MAKIEVTHAELVWPGKYNENGKRQDVKRARLPFQVIERINESRATREINKLPKQHSLFDIYDAKEGDTFQDGWHNKLIWGDNLLVMGSLLEKFSGKIDMIYIDPPFATGADFSFTTQIGDENLDVTKEQSIIEEKAYRDTWSGGLDSYLAMLFDQLVLLRELLSETGAIFVHLDVHTGPYIKPVMDEIFGRDNFQNMIAWYYYNKLHGKSKRCVPKAFDMILYYLKNRSAPYTFHTLTEPRDEPVKKLKYRFTKGKIENLKDEFGKTITYESTERQIDNVWRIRCLQPANLQEWVNYDTQKPVDLIERILQIASNEGDLILDAFCGSGSSLVAAERSGRRWIGCDLGRFAIHTTRKRLLSIENCKPFEILNLGKYERQYWQGATFGNDKHVTEQALYEYLAFILKLYGAQPISGMMHLHGKKGKAMIHIGAVDSPVTIDEINLALDECARLKQTDLHVLGWEWEMGLAGPSQDNHIGGLMHEVAKQKGIKLFLLQIPREVMEQQAVEKGDVQFFELAYLEAEIRGGPGEPQLSDKHRVTNNSGQSLRVSNPVSAYLKDFVIANTELIPAEVREKVKKWSDYIDYWAVDWDFQNDTFMNGWVTYRTRKERCLALQSEAHTYEASGRYTIVVKVVDIFGNDTTQAYDVEVH